MSDQLELDLDDLIEPAYDRGLSLPERFEIFHRSNPHVADALERLVEDYLAKGNRRASIAMFYEVLRHRSGLRTEGSEYRLDNSFRAFYSRLLVARRPEWAFAFRFREQPSVEAA